jgi:hypothetical protein
LKIACGLPLVALLLAACATQPSYQPVSDVEARYYEQAARNVTPKHVLARFSDYAKTEVAWAGIVQSRKVTPIAKTKNDFEVSVMVEHRRFDWNQYKDPKKKEETFLLSTQSEGHVRITGRYSRPAGSKTAPAQELSPGTMVILYGRPEKIEKGGVVLLNSGYVRPIDKTHFSVREADVNPMR